MLLCLTLTLKEVFLLLENDKTAFKFGIDKADLIFCTLLHKCWFGTLLGLPYPMFFLFTFQS